MKNVIQMMNVIKILFKILFQKDKKIKIILLN